MLDSWRNAGLLLLVVMFAWVNFFLFLGCMQGSSQRSQGVAGRYALTVDVSVPLRLQKRRYAFKSAATPSKAPLRLRSSMSSFCWSFLPAVGRSKARVKYIKHVVRDEGDACFSFSSSAPHRDCTEGHVTSTSSQSSRKKKVLWKFTRLSSVVEKRSSTDLYIKIDVAQDSEGWGLFRDTDGAWRDHSFLATCLRLEELTINSATFLSVYFSKNIKRKHEKGVIGVGFVASSGMRLQPWLERFCSTLSRRRNRTDVASEARPRFSTLSWYVNHVNSGLATVSRRSPFFSHLRRFAVRRDSHLFDLGTRGWEAHTFLCFEEGAKPHRGFPAFMSSQSAAKCCKTKTWRSVWRQITYVFWHVITYCKTSLALHVCHRQVQRRQEKKCACMPCWLFWILVSFGRWKTL